ncbi:MAG: hypothetical protein MZV63_65495 [Marinilabiliales bacterium]|nr:hypothetical protein [Marinilabiliales bacterium]
MTLFIGTIQVDEAERRQAAPRLQLDRPDRLHRPRPPAPCLVMLEPTDAPALQALAVVGRRRRPLPRPEPRHLQGPALPHERQRPLRHGHQGPQQARRAHQAHAGERRRRRHRVALHRRACRPSAASRASGRSSRARSWPGTRRSAPGPLRHRRPVHERRDPGLLRQVLRHGLHLVAAPSGTSGKTGHARSRRRCWLPKLVLTAVCVVQGLFPSCLVGLVIMAVRDSPRAPSSPTRSPGRPLDRARLGLGVRLTGFGWPTFSRGGRAGRRPAASSAWPWRSAALLRRSARLEASRGPDLALRLPGPERRQPVRATEACSRRFEGPAPVAPAATAAK